MEVIGIQSENSFYRVACLSSSGGEVSIKYLEKKREAPTFEKEAYPVTGIEGQDLLIRHLKTPLKKKKALYKTLPFQLEPLIPYSLDEVVVKPLYNIGEKETEITFFTTSKKNLNKHISSFQERGIDPEGVSAVPVALYRFARFICPMTPSLVIFHIGEEKIQIVSIQTGKICNHLTLHIGSGDFNDSQAVNRLKQEVDRAFCFLAHKEGEEKERNVFFCGEMAREIESLLHDYKGCTLTPIDIEGKKEFDAQAIRSFAIPIGLAIDALKNDHETIQFRQEEFISESSLGLIKKQLLRGGVAMLALLAAGGLFFHLYFKREEENLLTRVETIVHSYEEGIPALKEIKHGGKLKEVLGYLDRSLHPSKAHDKYFAPPPLVSDLLAFLSAHPKLKGIEIKGINYELKSYPSVETPEAIYHPKVSIHFSSLDSQKARDFHDAIIDAEIFIDRSKEIKWNRNKNEYEITFFLQSPT